MSCAIAAASDSIAWTRSRATRRSTARDESVLASPRGGVAVMQASYDAYPEKEPAELSLRRIHSNLSAGSAAAFLRGLLGAGFLGTSLLCAALLRGSTSRGLF